MTLAFLKELYAAPSYLDDNVEVTRYIGHRRTFHNATCSNLRENIGKIGEGIFCKEGLCSLAYLLHLEEAASEGSLVPERAKFWRQVSVCSPRIDRREELRIEVDFSDSSECAVLLSLHHPVGQNTIQSESAVSCA